MAAAVSILLPVRNAASTLSRCLESIRGQTEARWELLLADDGSEDDSIRIAQALFQHDPRLRILPGPRRGIVQALNEAAKQAQSSVLLRMDADDVMHPERLERQLRFLERTPAVDLVACTVRYMGCEREQSGYARYVAWTNALLTETELQLNRFVESPFAHPSVAMRTKAFFSWGGYREGPFPEDYALWLEAWSRGARMAKLPEPLLDWYDPPDRLSRQDPRYSIDRFYRLKCEYLHLWLQEQRSPSSRLILWGSGRVTRSRFRSLEERGSRFEAFVDVNARKIGQKIKGVPVLSPGQLSPDRDFVLAGVGNHGARELILRELQEKGFKPGVNCLAVA